MPIRRPRGTVRQVAGCVSLQFSEEGQVWRFIFGGRLTVCN